MLAPGAEHAVRSAPPAGGFGASPTGAELSAGAVVAGDRRRLRLAGSRHRRGRPVARLVRRRFGSGATSSVVGSGSGAARRPATGAASNAIGRVAAGIEPGLAQDRRGPSPDRARSRPPALVGLLGEATAAVPRLRGQHAGGERRLGPAPHDRFTGSAPARRSPLQSGHSGWNARRPCSSGRRRCAVRDAMAALLVSWSGRLMRSQLSGSATQRNALPPAAVSGVRATLPTCRSRTARRAHPGSLRRVDVGRQLASRSERARLRAPP